MRSLLLVFISLWLSQAAADTAQSRDDKIAASAMWRVFLKGYVDSRCFRSCWERWLPMDIDFTNPGYYIVYPKVTIDWLDILDFPSEEYCKELSFARSFQRCYVSHCGGLFTKVPSPSMGSREGEKPKLWAWSSTYVARYGLGDASFEDYVFLPDDNSSWGPFQLGLTAACSMKPGQVFSPNLTDDKLIQTMSIMSTEERFLVPQTIRRLLSPIWTSPNLLDHWSHSIQSEDPQDRIKEPRPLTDLRKKIIATYLFAFIAYAHLLSMSSQSKYYFAEGFQLLAFCLIPLLPAVQMLRNFIDTLILLLDGKPWTRHYLLSGISGVVLYEERNPDRRPYRVRLLEIDVVDLEPSTTNPRDGKWWLRLSGILTNLAILIFAVVPYFTRLAYRFHGASFCATTGFDHRVGWIATAALMPIIATLNLHVINRDWTLGQAAERNRKTASWMSRLSLEIAAATAILELLIMLTGRVTAIHILLDRLLKGAFQIFLPLLSVLALVLVSVWQPLSLIYSNPNRWLHKSVSWSLLSCAISYAIIVFLLQIFLDKEEYADLALNFVLPWNYRWQIPNPAWSEWWGL